jgi:hypothetical protein
MKGLPGHPIPARYLSDRGAFLQDLQQSPVSLLCHT